MRAHHLTGWTAAVVFAVMTVACGQSDVGITTAVKAKLAADDEVKAYQIDVNTKDRVVTLTGSVDTETARTRALELARLTDGVSRVANNLIVRDTTASMPPSEPDPQRVALTDPAVTATLKGKLLADPIVSGLKIDVDTQDGVVTLTGTVGSETEREQAVGLARDTAGVMGVEDKLIVKVR